MANWKRTLRMTHGEYRANIEGLNIFFGAVLGFVLAGAEALAPLAFAKLLFATAALVISILYVTSSQHRFVYALLTAALVAAMPRWLGEMLPAGASLPPKLQPTMAVWLAMTVLIEVLPRDREAPTPVAAPD